ncbi:hypothetical protein NHH03_22475 [Stieleria sp. TO1_6]|nr:hypothetical protein [Stieleria tagensis]
MSIRIGLRGTPSGFGSRLLGSVVIVFILGASVCNAQQSDSAAKPQGKTKLEVDIDRSLERYSVYVDGDTQAMKPVKVLTWNNPLAGGVGKFRTVLYLKDGQPKAVCCIWPGPNKKLYHEFGTLTRSPIVGKLDGKPSWEMGVDLIQFHPVPESDPPSTDRRRRLLQMKDLIRRFTAVETLSRKGEATREQLRLLPTPLYRYEKASEQITDGAVFCFAHTTDPEALVLLEAVPADGELRWQYTFIRRTTLPVTGYLDGNDVWSTDRAGLASFNQLPMSR